MSETPQPYDTSPKFPDSWGETVPVPIEAIRARVDAALHQVKQRQRTMTHAPRSPLHVRRKMGFRDVLWCDCGAVLDLNTAEGRRQSKKAWASEHQECRPAGEDDATE